MPLTLMSFILPDDQFDSMDSQGDFPSVVTKSYQMIHFFPYYFCYNLTYRAEWRESITQIYISILLHCIAPYIVGVCFASYILFQLVG